MSAHRIAATLKRPGVVFRAIALAVGITGLLIGVALASTFTLKVAKNAPVTNVMGVTTTENIVVTSRGHAVYELSGDRKGNPKCKKGNGCFAIWPPVTVRSRRQLTKSPAIKGRLGIWRRAGILQVTLSGHPLYRFSEDSRRDAATGQDLHSFGGTWHVVTAGAGSGTTSTTPTTTMPTGCAYPPCA